MIRVFALISILFFAAPIYADSESVKVVAVVNDQIISSIDLNDRLALVIATTGIADNEATRAKILPQILQQLIDEKLQLQEATKLSINISDAKLHDAVAQIEKQSGKSAGSLEQFLSSRNVSQATFNNQIRSQLAWNEIITRKIRTLVRVSDQEVARYVKRKPSIDNKSKEVLIASILLPIDSAKNEKNTSKLAEKLATEIHSGTSFEAIAAQFSSNSGGAKANDPFWVELSNIDPLIASAIVKMAKNGVTDAIKTENGYQIIKLFDVRAKQTDNALESNIPQAEVAFKQIILNKTAKNQEEILKLAKEISASELICDDKKIALKNAANVEIKTSFIRNMTANLPSELLNIINKLKVGSNSEPIILPNEVRIYKLCERVEVREAKAKTDNNAKQAIFEEKLGLEVQKYIRNLRSGAFIEMRGF
ncbi:MAG: SurA N-terminal domain-containing protein [Pseudomonadota bacterium]